MEVAELHEQIQGLRKSLVDARAYQRDTVKDRKENFSTLKNQYEEKIKHYEGKIEKLESELKKRRSNTEEEHPQSFGCSRCQSCCHNHVNASSTTPPHYTSGILFLSLSMSQIVPFIFCNFLCTSF